MMRISAPARLNVSFTRRMMFRWPLCLRPPQAWDGVRKDEHAGDFVLASLRRLSLRLNHPGLYAGKDSMVPPFSLLTFSTPGSFQDTSVRGRLRSAVWSTSPHRWKCNSPMRAGTPDRHRRQPSSPGGRTIASIPPGSRREVMLFGKRTSISPRRFLSQHFSSACRHGVLPPESPGLFCQTPGRRHNPRRLWYREVLSQTPPGHTSVC